MKKIFKYISILALPMAIILTPSCTDGFEGMNTNNQGVYEEDLKPDDNLVAAYMPGLQKSIFFNNDAVGVDWTYQLYQNLNADMFSGMMSSLNFGEGNLNYKMNDGWNSFGWNTSFRYSMASVKKVHDLIAKYPEIEMSAYGAWTNILKVAIMHRITDAYGPMIYTKYGASTAEAKYDDQKTIYYAFFKELDESTKVISDYEVAHPNNTRFKKADLIYSGQMPLWIKYANTLRLRLAMNIVKVDPAKAKIEAEKAIAAGVLESVSENAAVTMRNPQGAIAEWGGDAAMSADMESMLKGYKDPRLSKYFRAGNSKVKTNYTGMRLGVAQKKDDAKNPYLDAFFVANFTTSDKVIIASAAEAYFLRAEGALRGWNMDGTAKELYESGITVSFNQHGVILGKYLSSNDLPIDYVDAKVSANSHPAVNKVSPAWSDGDTKEIQLQKIITQKWLALFPDGHLAWTDFRRTGYPKLFPVVKNASDGVVSTELGPRRLPFPDSERTGNATNYADGVSKLGGADNAGTRLWWDVNKANF